MTHPNSISAVTARLFRIPLDEVLTDAMHGDHTHFELVTTTIVTADGREGTGYSYTGGRGGAAIRAMVEYDLAPFLLGRDAGDIAGLYDGMLWHMHYVGRGGIAAFAISTVDIALWDIAGRTQGRPLWQMAGGAGATARAYRGGIDLNYPLDKLIASVAGYLAEGYDAVKIKVGQPTLAEDVRRLEAIRSLIGPERSFMVDANYGFDVAQAIAAADAFRPFDLTWFEEPTSPDDYFGYAAIAEATTVPLAMGENLHTLDEFKLALDHAALSYITPDASNCGGVTGWLRAAELAERKGIPVCSHGMQELHVSLVAARPNAGWIEVHSFPIDRYTHQPLVRDGGMAIAPDTPGIGVEFNWPMLAESHQPRR